MHLRLIAQGLSLESYEQFEIIKFIFYKKNYNSYSQIKSFEKFSAHFESTP